MSPYRDMCSGKHISRGNTYHCDNPVQAADLLNLLIWSSFVGSVKWLSTDQDLLGNAVEALGRM